MKKMTDEELKIRLRRTVINKYSTTAEHILRNAIRQKAFNDRAFTDAVDDAVTQLFRIHSGVIRDRNEIQQKRTESIEAKRKSKKAKREAKYATAK